MIHGHIGHHFADTLAAQILIILKHIIQMRIRRIGQCAGIHVAEGNDLIRIGRSHVKDIFVCLRKVDLRIDDGQDHTLVDTQLGIAFQQLLNITKLRNKGNGVTVTMGMEINKHKYHASFRKYCR